MAPKKIFIAGTGGFLGGTIAARLGVHRAEKKSGKRVDLTNLENCLRLTKGVDLVINAAGVVTSRKDQVKRPAGVFYTNALIDFQLLEACRINKVPRYIAFSSITAFPPEFKGKLNENYFFSGAAPRITDSFGFYGLSRWLVPFIARAYALQYGIKTRVIVFPNLYGPGDKFHHEIPPLVANLIKNISATAEKKEKTFYGGNNGHHRVDLLYIDDAVDFIEKIIKNFGDDGFASIAAGSGKTVSIAEVCSLVAKYCGFKGKILWDKGLPGAKKYLDSGSARQLGWKPKVEIEKGLAKTVAFYKKEILNKS
jgi:GDP-L-fucose synthase